MPLAQETVLQTMSTKNYFIMLEEGRNYKV